MCGWSEAYAAEAVELRDAWADDAVLDRVMTLPFGTMPGRGAAAGRLIELAAHGWELADATGQQSALNPEVAGAAWGVARQLLPAEPRGGHVPFGPVVDVPAQSAPYDQLAGWLGRTPVGA